MNKKIITAIAASMILLLFLLTAFIYCTTLKNDNRVFSEYIKEKYSLDNVEIVKKVENKGEIFLLYRDNQNVVKMIYFEQNKYLRNRYVFSGGGQSSQQIGHYVLTTPQEELIVLFGDNTTAKASQISFVYGEKTYTKKIIGEDYILLVYRFEPSNSSVLDIRLTDEKGKIIE